MSGLMSSASKGFLLYGALAYGVVLRFVSLFYASYHDPTDDHTHKTRLSTIGQYYPQCLAFAILISPVAER